MKHKLSFSSGEAVVLPADHPLVIALRPSPEALEKIERMERANALARHALRNVLLGSSPMTSQARSLLSVIGGEDA